MVESSQPKKSKAGKLEEEKEATVTYQDLGKIKLIQQDFVSQMKSWEDEDFALDEDLKKGIVEELEFNKPSRIQKHAIPMIAASPYKNLIAQSKNGSGKTGAFVVGSCLRIDRKDTSPQVLLIANSKIMVTQIADIYKKLVKHTEIKVVDTCAEKGLDGQVLVCTLGKIKAMMADRKKPKFSSLKVIIFDEADVYFDNENDIQIVKHLAPTLPKNIQYVLFSATFKEEVKEVIYEFVKESQSIALKAEKLSLDNIVQLRADLPKREKVNFLSKLYKVCSITQCIVFVNTRSFAVKVLELMKDQGLKANIVFGKGMEEEERQKVIQKFRDGTINFLITTDLISRGFDVSTVKLVVNFDVPVEYGQDKCGDAETYLHRIGRAGRFGTKACSVTLIDRPEDKIYMDQIVEKYSMQEKVLNLENPEQVKVLLEQIMAEEIASS